MKSISHIKLGEDYIVQLGNQLGNGAHGSVYEGKDLKIGKKVAIKIIKLETLDNQVLQYLLKMEKTALMRLNNPYIVKGYKVWENRTQCFLVTEFCNGTTLKEHIISVGKLSEERSYQIIRCILEGCKSFFQKQILHRDLKPSNIMLHDNYPKIIDFGYCQIQGFQKPSLQYNVGSPSYMAPQSHQFNIYTQKTQVWAIGAILFQCITGRTLDQGKDMRLTYKQIQEDGVPFPNYVSQKSRNIINWSLSMNPKNRPTFNQFLNEIIKLEKQQQRIKLNIEYFYKNSHYDKENRNNVHKENKNNVYKGKIITKNNNPNKICIKQGITLKEYQPKQQIQKQKTERITKYIHKRLSNHGQRLCQNGLVNYNLNNKVDILSKRNSKKTNQVKINKIGFNFIPKRIQQGKQMRQKLISVHHF